jgi:hypothetical protein
MTTPIDRDAVLVAFASESVHDRNTLVRYVRRYPECTEELIDLASELRMSADFADAPVGPISDPTLNADWANFVAAMSQAATKTAAATNPFSQFRGVAFASLATKMDVPRSILAAIRDRLVSPETIPIGFLRRFAEATESSMDVVNTYIARDSQAPPGLAFKSDEKPSQQGQTTFRKLVESTPMSESQRVLLLRECEEHELT